MHLFTISFLFFYLGSFPESTLSEFTGNPFVFLNFPESTTVNSIPDSTTQSYTPILSDMQEHLECMSIETIYKKLNDYDRYCFNNVIEVLEAHINTTADEPKDHIMTLRNLVRDPPCVRPSILFNAMTYLDLSIPLDISSIAKITFFLHCEDIGCADKSINHLVSFMATMTDMLASCYHRLDLVNPLHSKDTYTINDLITRSRHLSQNEATNISGVPVDIPASNISLSSILYFPSDCTMLGANRVCTKNPDLLNQAKIGNITVNEFMRQNTLNASSLFVTKDTPISQTASTQSYSPVVQGRLNFTFLIPSVASKVYTITLRNMTCISGAPIKNGLLLINQTAVNRILLSRPAGTYNPDLLCRDIPIMSSLIKPDIDGANITMKSNFFRQSSYVVSYTMVGGAYYFSMPSINIKWYSLNQTTINLMQPFDISNGYVTVNMVSNYIANVSRSQPTNTRRKRAAIIDSWVRDSVIIDSPVIKEKAIHIRLYSCILNHCAKLDFKAGCTVDCSNIDSSVKKNSACLSSPEVSKSHLTKCAELEVKPGITGFGFSSTVTNSLRVMRDVLKVGRQSSNAGYLHGHHQMCYGMSDDTNTSHDCRKIASSDVNSVFFSGEHLEKPSIGDMVFIPTINEIQCGEDAVFKNSVLEISTDGSYDTLSLSVRTMERIQHKEANASFCMSIICDLCVIQVPMKFLGECQITERLSQGLVYNTCNREKYTIAYTYQIHHNNPHMTTSMKHSSFFIFQIYYYIISLFPNYNRITENKGPNVIKGELQPGNCIDHHFPIPDGRQYDISLKCGANPLAIHRPLNLESACSIYTHDAPWYLPFPGLICRNWILIKYAASTIVLSLVVFILYLTRIERIFIFILSYLTAPISYLLYMCIPTAMTCQLCHSIWTPIHICETLCVCGQKSSIHHCTLYPNVTKKHKKRGAEIYEYSTIELIKAFITQNNGLTRGVTTTVYILLLYILICYMTPAVLAENCCTKDVDQTLSTSDKLFMCTITDTPIRLLEYGSTKTTCAVPGNITYTSIAHVIVTKCKTNMTIEKLQISMASFSSLDLRKAATQCALFGTQNQFTDDQLKIHLSEATYELSYQDAEYKYDKYTVDVQSHIETTGQIPQSMKSMLDSLPSITNPRLKLANTDLHAYYNPSSIFFTTSNSGSLSALLKMSTVKGAGASYIVYTNGVRTPLIMTMNVVDVRNIYTLEYQYSSCKLGLTSNSSHTCYGDQQRCVDKISYPTTHCTKTTEPDRFEPLPGCTVLTIGEICTKCFVQPLEHTCLDVYRHEYVGTEIDICISASTYSKCTTIKAGSPIIRPSIQIEAESIPGHLQYPLVAIDKTQSCLTGPINEVGSDTLAFGYPQFNYRKDVIKYECDMETSASWDSRKLTVGITQCVKDYYNLINMLHSCGHSYITTDPPSMHTTPIASGSVTFSMTIPGDSLKIMSPKTDIKMKSCKCTGCYQCSSGVLCKFNFETKTSGLVSVSSPHMTVATTSIDTHRGVNSVGVFGYSVKQLNGLDLFLSVQGSKLGTFKCQTSLASGNPMLPSVNTQPSQYSRMIDDIKGTTMDVLDYLNPMHYNLGPGLLIFSSLATVAEFLICGIILYYVILGFTRCLNGNRRRMKKEI